MRRVFVPVFLVLLALFFVGCSVQYNQALRKWTRKANNYSFETFDARILFRATYLSPGFRQAAKNKIDEWMHVAQDDFIPDVHYLEDVEEGDFFVSVYVLPGYPLLNSKGERFWEFRLELPDGQKIDPTLIQSVSVTEREKRLFPYVDRWSRVYYVKFPVTALVPPFTLALRGVGGTSLLKWEVEE